jgi:hypothetical protein
MALTVMPTAIDATVRYRKPPIDGAWAGLAPNQLRNTGENGLKPASTVAPGAK